MALQWNIGGLMVLSTSPSYEFNRTLASFQATSMLYINILCIVQPGEACTHRGVKVPEFIIEANMRWSKVQKKSGGLPNLPMTELYLEITQSLATKTAFSFAL